MICCNPARMPSPYSTLFMESTADVSLARPEKM
jgi:hypothetical protein